VQDDAQEGPQPGEDETEIVSDGSKDDVSGVACATFEIAAAEMAVALQVPDNGLEAERRLSSRLMTPNTPRFCPEMNMRRGFAALWPRYPLST
jgi:hypothetical protein